MKIDWDDCEVVITNEPFNVEDIRKLLEEVREMYSLLPEGSTHLGYEQLMVDLNALEKELTGGYCN